MQSTTTDLPVGCADPATVYLKDSTGRVVYSFEKTLGDASPEEHNRNVRSRSARSLWPVRRHPASGLSQGPRRAVEQGQRKVKFPREAGGKSRPPQQPCESRIAHQTPQSKRCS